MTKVREAWELKVPFLLRIHSLDSEPTLLNRLINLKYKICYHSSARRNRSKWRNWMCMLREGLSSR